MENSTDNDAEIEEDSEADVNNVRSSFKKKLFTFGMCIA